MSASHQFYLAIRLGSLLNLNIRQTAFYQIRTTVCLRKNGKQYNVANPIQIISSKNPQEELGQTQAEILEDNTCLSPKLFIKHNSRTNEINTMYIFKGEIGLPESITSQHQISLYCELLQFSGKEVEVVGEWTGRTPLHCLNSHMEIYFSSHFLSCAVSASIHCVLYDFCMKNEQIILKFSKSKTFYNYVQKKMTNLYDAALDPLIFSIAKISEWRQLFKSVHLKEKEESENVDLRKSVINLQQRGSKYHALNLAIDERKLSQNFLSEEMQKLKQSEYLQYLKHDAHRLSEHIYLLWKDYMGLFKKYPISKYYGLLQREHQQCLDKNHWLQNIQIVDEKGAPLSQEFEKREDLEFHAFEQHLCKIKMGKGDVDRIKTPPPRSGRDLVMVLVHGYQATSFDMEMIAMYLRFRNPSLHILISQTNEGRTEGSIEECGHRLAVQVKNYINLRQLKDVSLSFMGHSMGGIIVRASLPYLQLYRNHFHCYISLCSPHLGYLYHTSKLVTTSIWVMNQIKKDQSMIELTMSDDPNLTRTYLYGLSERQQLSWFKSVIFLGSRQDEYVPFCSALLQNMDFFYESSSARTYQTIYNNILKSVEDKLIRMEIVYNQKVKDLSTLIGRTGHIKVLSFLPIIDLYTHLVSKQL